MGSTKRSHPGKLLSSTRPKAVQRPKPTLSSKKARTLIRAHHNLQKQLQRATSLGDEALIKSLQAQIDRNGGLEAYQRASIQGQSAVRGGDSSKVLVGWLKMLLSPGTTTETQIEPQLRLLEVGTLRIDNACARSGLFEVERIDLHSQHPEILEQDFMQRPILDTLERQTKGFDVVSLSLVVNYVGDATKRGEMLRRAAKHLRARQSQQEVVPGLFLVLPAPCVLNSRYLDEGTLIKMMTALGYVKLESKSGNKLVYYYFRWLGEAETKGTSFKKVAVKNGARMNNFSIVFD